MKILRYAIFTVAILAAVFVSGIHEGRKDRDGAARRAKALSTALTDAQRVKIARLESTIAKQRDTARVDSLKRVIAMPEHSTLVAAAERAFEGARVAIGDPKMIAAEPLRPEMPDVPVIPDSITARLFPGGAWVIRLPNDPQPHLADSALYTWGIWADRQLTHYRLFIRDTAAPAHLELRRALNAANALLSLRESTQSNTDSVVAILKEALTEKGLKTLAAERRAALVYGGLFTIGDAANAKLHFDVDRGGYVDSWRTQDKLTHAFAGALLAETAMDLGVKPRWAVLITCAGAAGFELSQGYASGKDAAASCGGAAIMPVVRSLFKRGR